MRDNGGRREVYNYLGAKKAKWPSAEFIIGNPPFIGNKKMRADLGDGYVEALREVYKDPLSGADFVMYWWHKSATILSGSKNLRSFGFISTDSIKMISNRKVVSPFLSHRKKPISLNFAVSNHPWVSSSDGAAVEISMTVCQRGSKNGNLLIVIDREKSSSGGYHYEIKSEIFNGKIQSDLSVGANLDSCIDLKSNRELSWMGVIPNGVKGFRIGYQTAKSWDYTEPYTDVIKPYLGGAALKDGKAPTLIIDLHDVPLTELQTKHLKIYQHLLETVKVDRDTARRKKVRENWWLFEESRPGLRRSIESLDRYIATVETTKHRAFSFVGANVIPDQKLRVISSDDASLLAILSSKIHIIWATSTGGDLGPTPVYNNTVCFDPFPFPYLFDQPALKSRLSDLGERLDKHRKDRQAEHPRLTLTQMYNVLENLRAGDVIEGKNKQIYEDGLIGILRQIHDEIDAVTAEAYGWLNDLSDENILKCLVKLNRERALEEAKGQIRWLRPEYQNPDGAVGKAKTSEMNLDEVAVADANAWPKALPEQMAAVREALLSAGLANVEDIRSQFKRAQTKIIKERLDTLAALGQAEVLEDGRYAV